MVGIKSLTFKITDVQFSTIAEVKQEEKGKFNIIGSIRWISEISKATHGKRVRDAVVADETGHIIISFWEDLIDIVKEDQWYEISNVSIKHYFGKKLNSSTVTKIKKYYNPIEIDWTIVEMTIFKKQQKEVKTRTSPTLCCPDGLSAKLNIFPTCPTPNCHKRIELPGDIKIVRCASCGNRSLAKKLHAAFIGEINFIHKEKTYQLTIFPEVLNKYLSKANVVKRILGQDRST